MQSAFTCYYSEVEIFQVMFPNLGFPEVIVLLGIGLLIFGPKKLPELGKSIGEAFMNFKQSFQKSSGENLSSTSEAVKDK